MKIAILTEYYPSDQRPGSGVYVHLRAAAYRRAGHDARVFRIGDAEPAEYEWEGVPVQVGSSEVTRAGVADFKPTVVALHTPHPSAPHTRVAFSLSTPIVCWIHGYEAMVTAFFGYHRGFGRPLSLLHDARKLWRLRRLLRDVAAVVHVSDWMRRTTERTLFYRHPRTEVIPNPVDTQRFRPRDDGTGGRLRGLALRGLNVQYGLAVAIDAFAGVDDTDLTIVGLGPDADRLRARIETTSAAVQLQERAVDHRDVPGLLRGFDYFLAPGKKETQGLAMCEAMACGLPVVGSRAGGVPEYVRDGVDGILVEPGSVPALRRGVRSLVRDPERARSMGRKAREHMVQVCETSIVIPRELELLGAAAA